MVANKSKAQAGNVLLLAEEINYLIYAYFLESGFEHSAYNLRSEARLDISSDTKQLIHRGRLVEYLAKALLYVEVETHFDRPSSTTCNAGFTLLGKHHCSSSSGSKRLAVAARADDPPPHASAPVSVAHAVRESMAKRKLSAVTGAPEEGANAKRVKSRHSAKGPNSDDASMHDVVRPPLEPPRPEPARSLVPRSNLTNGRHTEQPPISGHWSISPIGAHAADIRACSWNPHFGGLLATASTDGSINIWDTTREGDAPAQYQHPDNGDIVGLEWSSNGRWLASASVTGTLAVWQCVSSSLCEAAGTLECSSPIRSLRFSPSGDFIALAHLDGKVTVWNVLMRSPDHTFNLYSLPCLDVDWRDDRLLASCSDMQIAITALDSPRDVLSWKAHDDEINQIRFSRDRRLLASCSDDGSAKVWRIIQSTTDDRVLDAASKMQLVTVLSGHNSRVTRLEWSPALPEDSLYIITCAIDSSARVWDVMSGQCLQHVGVHQTGCYAAAFSPNGRLFATAGGDGSLYVAPFERWKHSERLVAWTDDQGQPVHDVAFNLVDGRQSLAVIAGRRVLLVRIA